MRADAQRNRDRLLDAAIGLILQVGAEPPLDAIARRAEVGIGTLYRHFPDREQLLGAVAEHVLVRAIDAAEAALESDDPVRSYLHAAVEHGVGVLNLLHPVLDGPDWSEPRDRIAPLLERIMEHGRASGRLRPEVRTIDLVAGVIRFSRPLAIGLSAEDDRALARRHLDVHLDGLAAAGPDLQPLPEPAVLNRWPAGQRDGIGPSGDLGGHF